MIKMLGNPLVPKPWPIHSYPKFARLGNTDKYELWVVGLSTFRATMFSTQPLFQLWPDKAGYRVDKCLNPITDYI